MDSKSTDYAKVFSPTNIALAKYWGKRNRELNLPANSSLSATLQDLGTLTSVHFDSKYESDQIYFDNKLLPVGPFYTKARVVLDHLRQISGRNTRAQIKTTNNFPTAAGLASSASGLSALALAASAALKLELTKEELSVIARRASGSACRSFWGGYVLWKKGIAENGEDSRGEQIAKETDWPLDVLVLVTCQTEKSNPSTSGMMTTQSTSPSFGAWIKFAEESTLHIRSLVAKKDFLGLAQACEQNCLMMHSTAMTSQPPLIYWHPQTLAVIQKVFDMRSNGYELFFTIDAGPNVVLFIQDKRLEEIKKQFQSLGDLKIIESKVGEGAKILEQ